MNVVKQWLFFDRTDICTGTSKYAFDEKRLSEKKRKDADELYNYWNFCMKIGPEHGLSTLRVPFGIRFFAEKARVTDFIFSFDEVWEQGHMGYHSWCRDEEKGVFRLWYTMNIAEGTPAITFADGTPWTKKNVTLYAESKDGFNWEKPKTGILYCGGKEMNAINVSVSEGSIWADPLHPETGRFKAVDLQQQRGPDGSPQDGVYLGYFGSEDGLHFKELDVQGPRYFFDTQNILFYDELLKKYVGYFRGHYNGRAIQRAEGDTMDELTAPQILLFPDNEDPMDADYYNNCCTPYPYDPRYRIILSSIYRHGTDELFVRMGVSRNGRQYQWVSREPVIGTEDENGNYFSGAYACPHMQKMGDFVGLPLRCPYTLHNEGYFHGLYKEYSNGNHGIRMALWEKDRLAGIEADEVGEFWLQIHPEEGQKLQVNAKTRGQGGVFCELVTQREDLPVEGYAMSSCKQLRGNLNWETVRWDSENLPVNQDGKDVFLHVRLDHAKIYGVRIVSESERKADEDQERIVSAHLTFKK